MYALPFILLLRLHHHALDARRRNRSWHYLAWSAVAAISAAVLLTIGVSLVGLLWWVGWWWAGSWLSVVVRY